jgi:phosphatidylinositol glycan class C protein
VFGTLWILSPILITLTLTWSDDTIYAFTVFLILLHVALHDYTFVTRKADRQDFLTQRWQVDSSLSLNTIMFAAMILASRLPTASHVFSFTFFGITAFSFFPLAFKYMYRLSASLSAWLISPALVLTSAAGLWLTSEESAIAASIYLVGISVVTFLCPFFLSVSLRFKRELEGPWDIAHVEQKQPPLSTAPRSQKLKHS